MTDIEIANSVKLRPITEIAKEIGLGDDDIEHYGKYKCKIMNAGGKPTDKLVLVTAINPTSLGEGKTTTSIGLADGLKRIGKKVCLALREPSLGPVFGIKGGATGGGHAQIAPMEDINLHFTGDLHAITCANNLISSMIDNVLQHGNALKIDVRRILWNRAVDLNDRALRNVTVGLGGALNGVPREERFNITAASEIMAILCLSKDLEDLKRRVSEIAIAYDIDGKLIKCGELGVTDAVAIVLKDAIKPNLVQTLEGTPAIVHGGPFANIAHGCNSIIATRTALKCADYVITEAGFGADLGAEKFVDIKCRTAGLKPKCIVLVATVRALKYNGGKKNAFDIEDIESLNCGIVNLQAHIENLKAFGTEVVVAINKFVTDTDREIEIVRDTCLRLGAEVALCEAWAKGGKGGEELAQAVVNAVERSDGKLNFIYSDSDSIVTKIEKVAKTIYHAGQVNIAPKALRAIENLEKLGYGSLPICIAKTQYSFSDDATQLGNPTNYTFSVKDVELRSGAGFIVIIAGNIMLMPGLPKEPSAIKMSIDENLVIKGLF